MQKKIIGILVAIIISFNCLSVVSFADGEPGVKFSNPIPEYEGIMSCILDYEDFIKSALENTNTLYDKDYSLEDFRATIIDGLYEKSEEIELYQYEIPFSDDNINNLITYINYTIPQSYVTDMSMGWGYYTDYNEEIIYSIVPEYIVSTDTDMISTFEAKADLLLNGIEGNNYLTDYQKAVLLHDRLVINSDYDESGDNCYSAYGAIVDGKSVCEGYTKAYMYLLNRVGIENYFCSSEAMVHAWNIVKINNKFYHVDTTWDDPTYSPLGTVTHGNFLVSTNKLYTKEDHYNSEYLNDDGEAIVDYDTIPKDTTFDDYFWENSDTAFQVIDDNIYYIDKTSFKLMKWNINRDTKTVLVDITDTWNTSKTSMYIECFSKLSSDGSNLFFSTRDMIKKYDPVADTITIVWAPEIAEDYNWIYGFAYKDDGNYYCNIHNSPVYSSNETKTETSFNSRIYTVEKISNVYYCLKNGEVDNSFSGIINYNGKTYLVHNGAVNINPSNEQKEHFAKMGYNIENGIFSYDVTNKPAQKLSGVINMILGKAQFDYLYDFNRDEQINILDLVSAKKQIANG